MKKVLLILAISFNVSFSQTDSLNEALKYYPLNIGDYWQYEIGKGHLANNNPDSIIGIASFEIVGDTVLGNGKKYFHRTSKGMESHFMGILKTQFLRIDSTSGIVYGNNGIDGEFIIDSLFASINDTVQYFTIYDMSTKSILGIDTETKTCIPSVMFSHDFYQWDISKNFGLSWYYYGDGSQMDKYQYQLVYAKINGNESGTFVDVQRPEKVLFKYRLSQNYPNPFNPSTTISYSIPQRNFVQLIVYDILGREVSSLVNKEQAAGNYKVEFNASYLSSGVYFYRLQSGGFSETKKLILLQ